MHMAGVLDLRHHQTDQEGPWKPLRSPHTVCEWKASTVSERHSTCSNGARARGSTNTGNRFDGTERGCNRSTLQSIEKRCSLRNTNTVHRTEALVCMGGHSCCRYVLFLCTLHMQQHQWQNSRSDMLSSRHWIAEQLVAAVLRGGFANATGKCERLKHDKSRQTRRGLKNGK